MLLLVSPMLVLLHALTIEPAFLSILVMLLLRSLVDRLLLIALLEPTDGGERVSLEVHWLHIVV
jgi:hypothetical protein